jgi:hypothetical protein
MTERFAVHGSRFTVGSRFAVHGRFAVRGSRSVRGSRFTVGSRFAVHGRFAVRGWPFAVSGSVPGSRFEVGDLSFATACYTSRVRGVAGLDRPAIQWMFVACGAVLIGISTWMGVGLVRARRNVEAARAEAEQARLDREQTEASLARERAARESFMLQLGRERQAAVPAAMPTLTLTPVKTRSPRGPELAVPSTPAPTVELRLVLPPRTATDRAFTVTLRSWTTGDVLLTRGALRAGTANGKPAVLAHLASDVLTPGPYELLLSGGTPPTDVAIYEVSVIPPASAR